MPTPAKTDGDASPAAETTLPTVSVQEAMGLPEPMDFVNELKSLSSVPDVAPPGTHEPVTTTPPEGTPAAKPVEKTAPTAKPVVAPDKKSEEPAAPVVKPEVVAPPKVKVGDKEYTVAELEDLRRKAEAPPPVVKPEVVAPVVPKPTAEEQTAAIAQERQQSEAWIETNAKQVEAPIDEAMLDTILAGGPKAVAAFQSMRQRDIASAVLLARKGIFAQMNPVIQSLRDTQQPLQDYVSSAETANAVAEFNTAHPDLADNTVVVDSCAKALLDNDPAGVDKMTRTQFFDKVADMAHNFITTLQPKKISLGGKEYTVAELEALTAAATATPPAAGAGAAPVKAAPAAAPAVKSAKGGPKPLGSNSPGGAASGKGGKSSVADLLPS